MARRTPLERAVEAVIGGLITYVSPSAAEPWKTVFVLLGIGLILHAVLQDR